MDYLHKPYGVFCTCCLLTASAVAGATGLQEGSPLARFVSGEEAHTVYEVHKTRHMDLYHPQEDPRIEMIGDLLEEAYNRFESTLRGAGFTLSREEEPLIWLCFADHATFERYAFAADNVHLGTLSAYYSARTNSVAMVLPDSSAAGASTDENWEADDSASGLVLGGPAATPQTTVRMLTHELAHHFAFNRGLQKRGVVYPLWVAEGIALNFECDFLVQGEPHRAWRKRLIALRDQGELAPLRGFLVHVNGGFQDMKTTRARYAQAWGLFDCLLHEKPDALRAYLKVLRSEPAGRRPTLKAFESAFGPPEKVEAIWLRYLDELE